MCCVHSTHFVTPNRNPMNAIIKVKLTDKGSRQISLFEPFYHLQLPVLCKYWHKLKHQTTWRPDSLTTCVQFFGQEYAMPNRDNLSIVMEKRRVARSAHQYHAKNTIAVGQTRPICILLLSVSSIWSGSNRETSSLTLGHGGDDKPTEASFICIQSVTCTCIFTRCLQSRWFCSLANVGYYQESVVVATVRSFVHDISLSNDSFHISRRKGNIWSEKAEKSFTLMTWNCSFGQTHRGEC